MKYEETPQLIFDDRYVTSAEICKRLNIDASTLTAWKMKGKFPTEHIIVGERVKLWVRNDIESIINHLNLETRKRRG